jgi:transposase
MAQFEDLSRCLVAFDQDSTLVTVVEMSQSSWLVAGLVPGVARRPLKKQEADGAALLRLVERWRSEAVKGGRMIDRIVLAYEAGRDGFLVGALAAVSRDRELRHSSDEYTGVARASAGEDGPA